MSTTKKQVSAFISDELYAKISESRYGTTQAITKGLELVFAVEARPVEQMENQRLKDLERLIDLQDEQLKVKDEQLKAKDSQIENLQNSHNNYMLQMQTVLNQKAIEFPGAKKPWWQFW